MSQVPVWFLGDHAYWPAIVTVMQPNNSLGNEWPDLARLPSPRPIGCGEGRFYCFWHWRSACSDEDTGGVSGCVRTLWAPLAGAWYCSFFTVLVWLSTFCQRPEGGSSGACRSKKNQNLLSSPPRPPYVNIWKVLVARHDHGNHSVYGFSVWMSGHSYQRTSVTRCERNWRTQGISGNPESPRLCFCSVSGV